MNFKTLWKNEYFKTILLLAIILLSVVAFWFGSRAILATEYPFLAVASGSMVPTLQVGDLIVVQGISNFSEVWAAPYGTNRPGDIIVFHKPQDPDELIVHRAIAKEKINGTWYFKTKGDANATPDSWYNSTTRFPEGMLPQQYVVGKVVANVPYLGHIALTLRKPVGIFILVLILLALIALEFVFPQSSKEEEEASETESSGFSDTSIYKGYVR